MLRLMTPPPGWQSIAGPIAVKGCCSFQFAANAILKAMKRIFKTNNLPFDANNVAYIYKGHQIGDNIVIEMYGPPTISILNSEQISDVLKELEETVLP